MPSFAQFFLRRDFLFLLLIFLLLWQSSHYNLTKKPYFRLPLVWAAATFRKAISYLLYGWRLLFVGVQLIKEHYQEPVAVGIGYTLP
jgi:hypothetical protein